MTKHSLLYFEGAGRAEMIRICLSIAGADWEDKRFKYADWKDQVKPTTPLGSVPVLTIDGIPHVQSVALARYAGRLAGWYPSEDDPLAALVVDEVLESLNELMSKAPKSGDPEELYKLRTAFQENEMTQYAQFMEQIIQRNGGVGFTAKPQPTIADLALQLTVKSVAGGNWNHIEANFFESFPGIMATVKMIEENDSVKAYYDAKK